MVRPAIRVAFVSVVPSPYQRDLFAALAERPEVQLRVFYLEKAAPDSPWPEKPLARYETYLPGFWFRLAHARIHWNWRLPNPAAHDVVVCNTLMSATGQWLMRRKLRGHPWMFWGEKLGARSWVHDRLSAPLHQSSAIAAIGQWAERDYAVRFPKVRTFNIPYHCDLDSFLHKTSPPRESSLVTYLFCGQMIARKGLDLLLQAFAELPANTRLLLVGREAELPQLLAALPGATRDRIEYLGFKAPEALPEVFARADVFVLPSRYDGWGVVVNQALGAGLPMVLSDQVGAAYDLLTVGQNGFLFAAGNYQDLLAKLRTFGEDPMLAKTFGERSRQLALQWSPAHGAQRWVEALQTITR